MHQASVGFHCPECTRGSGQKVVRANQLNRTAVVTNALIALNLAIYVYGIVGGTGRDDQLFFDGALFGPSVAQGDWYRIVTSGFLHANALHVGLNCLVLYQLGQLMEPVLGRSRYLIVYMVAMLGGSFGVLLIQPDRPTVGASGAVFGLMGAAVATMRSRGINPFETALGGTIMLNLIITFTIPNISIGGHVGGLIGGFVAGWIMMDVGPSQWKNPNVSTAIVVALGFALAGGCLAIA
jgi:membrane associated rhomboid family serine protease